MKTIEKKQSGFDSMFSGNDKQVNTEIISKPPMKKNEVPAVPEAIEKEVRVTLVMLDAMHQKIKIMAHWELTTLKEIINDSLEKTIKEYEKSHGELIKVPKSKNGK